MKPRYTFDFDPNKKKPKYKVGDMVYAIDIGHYYPSYHDAYEYFGHDIPKTCLQKNDVPYKVIGIVQHEISGILLYAIQTDKYNDIYLLSSQGIKHIPIPTYINY